MKLKVLRITEDSTLESMPEGELWPEWPQDDIQRWIDIETAEREELRDLLTPMGLPPEIHGSLSGSGSDDSIHVLEHMPLHRVSHADGLGRKT